MTTAGNVAPILEVSDLSVEYGGVVALWDVTFRLLKSEMVAIIGPNGAGKTTTLKATQGLIRPRSGKVRLDGRDVTGMPANLTTAYGLSLVPEGRGIFHRMTVKENLELGAFTKRARRALPSNLEKVFEIFPILRDRLKQPAGSLSGGEQQMLAIARALMSEPDVLMLDEPSLGLAPLVVSRVFRALVELRRTSNLTILLVEQNAKAALGVADRAYLLENGRVVLEGRSSDMLNNPSIREAYMGI